ncbi:hypothetical protein [Nostoc sp.]|uniref:hypothetical protein n=1 Tax=Nostoc sp. TaxID=1180 RepID=UPI002FF7DF3F
MSVTGFFQFSSLTQCEFWDLLLFSNADIPAIAHPYICADLATCVWIQQAEFFRFTNY